MPELTTEFIEELTKKLRAIGSLKAVGDTWVSFDSSVPPGGVPFCGQTVSRALYADLLTWATAQGKMVSEEDWQAYAAANGGNCPYYSEGDSLTTFRMPCVLGYLRGSSVTTEGGTYKPQKLPNAKGQVYLGGIYSVSNSENALVDTTQYSDLRGATHVAVDNNQGAMVRLDLSKGNDIYEDGADVQPKTFHVLVGVYAVGVITNINNTDVSQLQTGLATLEANAVKSVNGKTPTNGNVSVSTWGKPNDTYQALTIDDFPYTAPRGGVLYLRCVAGLKANYRISINSHEIGFIDSYTNVSILFKKGDVISFTGSYNFYNVFFTEND